VFTRSGSTWAQQTTTKLTGSDATTAANFGVSVALSADGNTALIGGYNDNSVMGAAWVFTRSGSTWAQQTTTKLTGSDATTTARFGVSVALSADGNTALIGGYNDNSAKGAAWVFTRSGSTWTQQTTTKLSGSDATTNANFGVSVALSADGSTALIGGLNDSGGTGAAWVFTRSGSTWTQQTTTKLTGSDATTTANFGISVALSADGNTALIGGYQDTSGKGAAWVFGSPRISSPPSLRFGSQTTAQRGPVLWLPVQSSGQAPLSFTGPAQITPTGEFSISTGDDLCNGVTLPVGQSCWIGVQFAATAAGPRAATLSFGANNTYPPTATVALTGTGVAPNSGPTGPPGATGATGATGSTGATGPQGPAGMVQLVTCKTITKIVKPHKKKTSQLCTTKTLTGPVKFTTASVARAVLSRDGVVYATGIATPTANHPQLALSSTHGLRPGRYTLTRHWTTNHTNHTTSQTITLH
jgi:hypothetical protein